MKALMKLEELKTIDQLSAFLSGTQAVAFSVLSDKDARYAWVAEVLARFGYSRLGKGEKGVVRGYLRKGSGYSRQQITRMIQRYSETGVLQRRQRTVKGFARRYTAEDIRRLAKMDERHDTPCGPAVKKLCERAYQIFGQCEYASLASISVSHLYNLRKSTSYRRQRHHFQKTRPRSCSIGERRRPRPDGQPGYLRVDTVHQGDLDGRKGVYHINAVDEVTQFQGVYTVEKISERYLLPALKQLLETFPFPIRGFHSDNGSEYINQHVATLLEKLRIEFTKSRSRHSNDNALAESKNGTVVRKMLGTHHIPQRWAPLLNEFHQRHLNPYLNYHRPCFFPECTTDAKGKERKAYRYAQMKTPYDKLKSLPKTEVLLKPGVTFQTLDSIACNISDNQAAEQLQKARNTLFQRIREQKLKTG